MIKALVHEATRSADERLAEMDLPDKPPASHAASVRETLTDDHQRIRNLLGPLRELELTGLDAEPSLRQLELVGEIRDRGAKELPRGANVPVSASWRGMIDGNDRTRALRALEVSTITGLRKGLRRGSVWVHHSLSFRERDQLLISPLQWKNETFS